MLGNRIFIAQSDSAVLGDRSLHRIRKSSEKLRGNAYLKL